MRLRPHHLLCTQGYSGRGYSSSFVENMTVITTILRGTENTPVEIVFSTDDICSECPQMLGTDLCRDNPKVKRFDSKMIEYFGLEERTYMYKDIVKKINSAMTIAIMEDICNECSWYPISACKKNILGKNI